MNDRPDTPCYHGEQGSCARVIAWFLILTMILGGTLLCLSLSFGISVVCGG